MGKGGRGKGEEGPHVVVVEVALLPPHTRVAPMEVAIWHGLGHSLKKKHSRYHSDVGGDSRKKEGRPQKRTQMLGKRKRCGSLTLNTAGSFMSFQIPSTPFFTNSATSPAHHWRTRSAV